MGAPPVVSAPALDRLRSRPQQRGLHLPSWLWRCSGTTELESPVDCAKWLRRDAVASCGHPYLTCHIAVRAQRGCLSETERTGVHGMRTIRAHLNTLICLMSMRS